VFGHIKSAGEHEKSVTGAPTLDCASDPLTALKTMFVDMVMGRRIASGQDPILRPVFVKPHGVARGIFTIQPDLPAELRVGLLQYERFPAWVRFSSDTLPSRPDLRTTVGVGIKLFGVPGTKLLDPETSATTHDLLLQNHDVFFVDTARDMCEFTYAGVVQGDYGPYLEAHPRTQQILNDMTKVVPSVLATEYWSVLPYAFGSQRYVKYKLTPLAPAAGQPAEVSTENPSYLHADLRQRLLESEASFAFAVQLRTDPEHMPLDQATVRWEEAASSPLHVATLTLVQQDIDARGQATYGENLSFTPWHAIPEHAPVGSIADARKVAYQAAAQLRRDINGIPVGEPEAARPLATAPEPRDRKIVRAAIHPAIGVARVGNSQDGYFIGPEVVDPPPAPPGFYQDDTGALKRQAARFRVYGYNAVDEVVAELTADNADIRWSAHVANQKAAWYEFQIALDIPEASSAPQSRRRNRSMVGPDRAGLVIDPGPRTIRGRDTSGPDYHFDTGEFLGTQVYLGELRTDAAGRLLFLGGRGVSASHDGSPATDFANNDGWYDDISDGPVTAEVTINGQAVPVEPAWVAVAPPNYAPDVLTVRTMYDLLYDACVEQGWLPYPDRVSFTRHVQPILHRLSVLQWVNHGFATQFGWGGRNDFLDREYLVRLASNQSQYAELRRQVYTMFRDLDRDGQSPVPWPWIYGDSMSLPPISARQHLALSPTQYRLLERWADGDFDADLDLSARPPRSLDAVPLADQPATLDEAALTLCLADAFHPGCELTWPMRHTSMYSAPFRIRHRLPDVPEPSYGTVLTPDAAVGVGGPLYAQGPGGLTRWMAVPWQTDTASCRSGYYLGYGPRYDPYLPTFWPARVPNHVLTLADYQIITDPNTTPEDRQVAFERRANWYRVLTGDYLDQINQMVTDFGKLGVVETRPGSTEDPALPPEMMVESQPEFPTADIPPHRNLLMLHVPEAADPAVASRAVADAVAQTGRPEDEVTAGYINKVKRFPSGR
jgi:L-Lysine epsilon oxidase N-terminal/L-lysine epsilon oxidase C-terminal domain